MAETKLSPFQIDTVALGLDPDIQAGVSGSTALTDLTNVDVTAPNNSDVLTYNNISGNWEAIPHSVGVIDAINVNYDDTNTGLGVGSPSSISDVQTAIERLDTKRRFKVTTHTGIIAGGEITNPGGSPATFNISDGNGAIIDQVATPTTATGIAVSWTGLTGIALSQELDGFGNTYIFINSAGTVSQFIAKPSKQTFINNIFLGTIFYEAGAITVIFNEPDVIDTTAVNFGDYVDFQIGSNIHGLTPIAVGAGDPNSVLEFYVTDGEYFGLGSNWHTDIYNPNIITLVGNGTDTTGAIPWGSGAVFDYILGDGTVFATAQTILDETIYDDGTSTPGSAGNGDGIIQFIIELPGGKTYVQPFTQTYRDWKGADSSLQNALSNLVLPNEIKEGIIIGAYIGQQNTSSWERGDRSSLTGFGTSGGGGSSTPVSNNFYIDITTGVGSPLGILETALPSGWSTTYQAVGQVVVTHTLGDSTVGFALNVIHGGVGKVVNPTAITTNTIIFQITDTLNAPVEGNIIGKLLF